MKKQVLVSLSISLLAVVSLLLLVLTFMEGRFFPGTRVNGVDLSLMKREEAEKYFSNWKTDSFSLELMDKEGSVTTLHGKDIGLFYQADFSSIPKPDSFLMLFSMGKKKDYPLQGSLHYDEAALRQFAEQYARTHSTEDLPRANFVTAYVPGAGYLLGKGRDGGKIQEEALLRALEKAIGENVSFLDIERAGLYESAENAEDLQRQVEEKNAGLSGIVRYNFSGEVIELNSDTTVSWMTEDGREIDKNRLKAYVRALKQFTDSSGTERSFQTEDGRVLLLRGKYGFSLSEKKEEKKLTENLLRKENVFRDAEYDMIAPMRGADDIGNTYVEVDIGRQKIFYFENGVLQLSSDCVTGNLARRSGTPDGIYALSYKARNATLKGADYETKVNYWMPFNRGIGFHDALWRNRFGGTIYQRAGSHGCINLPFRSAESLYQKVYQGMPVICHN